MATAVHFFAAEADLPTQAAAGAFGPVAGQTATQYRLGSLFTGSATANDPLAYAVVTARVVFFVSDSDPSRYNLVLQPRVAIPGLPPVKYFIYRGIRRSDFLDEDGALVAGDTCRLKAVIAAATDGIEATKSYAAEAGTTPVDHLFFGQDNQFATVLAGESLGHFDTTAGFSYGLDIVLDEPGHQLTVAMARKADNVVDTATAADEDAKEAVRWAALAYLDPAAFYGLCLHSAFDVHHQAKKPYRQQQVYQLVAKFATKNQVYVDVRDRWGLPYGLLAGSTSTLRISQGSGSAASATPISYRNADQWPLHRLANNFSGTVALEDDLRSTLKLSLAADGNTHPLLQLQSGYWKSKFPENSQDLAFKRLTVTGGWTSDASFVVLSAKEDTATVPAATYLRLELGDFVSSTALSRQVPLLQPFDHQPFDLAAMFAPEWLSPPQWAAVTDPGINTVVRMQPYLTYGVHKESGVAFRRGVAVDADGLVAFCIRGQHFIPLENQAIVASSSSALLGIGAGDFADDGFWSFLGRCSAYQYDYLVRSEFPKGKPPVHHRARRRLDRDVMEPRKVNLTAPAVGTLEIRCRDPLVVRGHDYSPAEPFACMAYSTTERAAIVAIANDAAKFSALGPKFLVAVAPVVPAAPVGVRSHFRITLQVRGLTNSVAGFAFATEPTAINLYSVDGERYVSPAYATTAAHRIAGPVWNDGVVPDTVPPGDHPFADAAKYDPGLKAALQTQLQALAAVDARLLFGELRDALYGGDLERLSLEIAFRAPFLSERPRSTPYTQVTVDGIPKPNNPHFAQFETWLAAANALRALQVDPPLGALGRTGLTQALTDAIDAAPDHEALYVTIGKTRNAAFTAHHAPAYMGRVMEDENAIASYKSAPHIPRAPKATTTTYTAAQLAALVPGTIDEPARLYLVGLGNDAFGWKPIQNPSDPRPLYAERGYYIVKKGNAATFNIVHKITVADRSGITIGMGCDFGGQSLASYQAYTAGVTIPNATDAEEAVGKRGTQAAALFLQFDADIWNQVSMSYDLAVERTIPFMKVEYLRPMLRFLHPAGVAADRQFLVVFPQNGNQPFYETGAAQYLNEVEKAVLLSYAYNAWPANFALGTTSGKWLIQAINSHDLRWLRLAWREGRAHVDVARLYRLQVLLERTSTADHYDFTKTAF